MGGGGRKREWGVGSKRGQEGGGGGEHGKRETETERDGDRETKNWSAVTEFVSRVPRKGETSTANLQRVQHSTSTAQHQRVIGVFAGYTAR